MGHGLWVMATKSLQTKLGNAKPYGLLGSMGYTWYTLGGSLLYYSSGRLGRSQVRNVGCHGVVMATSRDSSPTISFPLFSTSQSHHVHCPLHVYIPSQLCLHFQRRFGKI